MAASSASGRLAKQVAAEDVEAGSCVLTQRGVDTVALLSASSVLTRCNASSMLVWCFRRRLLPLPRMFVLLSVQESSAALC